MEGLIVLVVYAVVGILLAWLAVVLYLRSVASRKHYTCRECGEQVTVELMNASHWAEYLGSCPVAQRLIRPLLVVESEVVVDPGLGFPSA